MYCLTTKHSERATNYKADRHQQQTSGIKSRLQFETVNKQIRRYGYSSQ